MTTYAYDPTTRHLVATWETGVGAVASTVTRLPARVDEQAALSLARTLTALSAATWLAYTDPDLAVVDPVAAVAALTAPNVPENGLLRREAEPHLDAAHEVGRRLLDIGGTAVARIVVRDVSEDLDGLDRALRGDLSGRARQAVELTRLDACPLQVLAADELLREVPMGSSRLFCEVEPTSAAVAAAHWLRAAVDVALAVSGWSSAEQVLVAADAMEEFDVTTVRVVLDLMAAGNSPLVVVRCLVRSAMLAARGMVVQADSPGLTDDPLGEPGDQARFTVLDPTRPSRALLERLTRGIQTCSLVHTAHLDPAALGPDSDPDRREEMRQVFDEHVRAEAGRTADRLLRTEPAPAP
jgi:hypothetical protein